MKTMTYDEKIEKCAKVLVKEFKEKKDDNGKTIFISDRFSTITQGSNRDIVFDHSWEFDSHKGANVSFGDIDEEGLAKVSCDVANKILSLIKLPKKVRVFKDERKETHWGKWYSHDYWWVKKIVFITPCKEFNDINKKLTHLGCNEIPFEKWWNGSVFGKRSDYSVTHKNYCAVSKEICDKVLAYLKGKKKLSYELVRCEDFENREYGERYETEWDGSLAYRLQFTDFKGIKTTI